VRGAQTVLEYRDLGRTSYWDPSTHGDLWAQDPLEATIKYASFVQNRHETDPWGADPVTGHGWKEVSPDPGQKESSGHGGHDIFPVRGW
jgi:hypothetical protein